MVYKLAYLTRILVKIKYIKKITNKFYTFDKSMNGRELLEETGYYANSLEELGTCPITPGLSTEQLTYVIATKLEKRTDKVGVKGEHIEVWALPNGYQCPECFFALTIEVGE